MKRFVLEERMQAPAFPADLLFQSIQINDDGEQAGYRIYSDGRYASCPAHGSWTPGEPLTSTQLAAVHRVLAEAQLDRLNQLYRAKGRAAQHILWTQARVDGQAIEIAQVGRTPVAAIDRLSARMLEIFRSRSV